MGYSLSWIATRGISPEEAHRLLGIRALAKGEPLPATSCTAAQLENGWHVVFFSDGCDTVDRCAKELIARVPEAITCFVEEHVMASGAASWKNGGKVWSVDHEAEKGIFHLDIQGTPPELLAGIISASKAEQEAEGGESADVDLTFDVPVALAEALVGFRHDGDAAYGDKDPWFVCETSPRSVRNAIKKSGCLPVVLLGGMALAGIISKATA